jgi:phosphoserine phosphatase
MPVAVVAGLATGRPLTASSAAMSDRVLVTLAGPDHQGITAELTGVLASGGAALLDVEQVVIHGQLTLCLLIGSDPACTERVLDQLRAAATRLDLDLAARTLPPDDPASASTAPVQVAVTVIGDALDAGGLHAVARVLANHGGNIERIHRLSDAGLTSLELIVSIPGAASDEALDERTREIRRALLEEAGALDIAVQREGLTRRAKRLVAMDMDSTLIQLEVIDELARRHGVGDQVSELTRRAMLGELDFEQSLRARVALLAGLDVAVLDDIARSLPLTDGAAALVRVLRRLGYRTAVISGGFTFAAQALKDRLGLDYAYANTLERAGGRLTGRVLDPVVTPSRKADLLDLIAQGEGIDLDQTIAIGDGANDLPMLERAGLGIAFHAKPKLTAAADTAVSHGGLDRVLYLLGLRARDVAELLR